MGEPARRLDERFTYRDYKNWPDEERWELIDGIAWDMSPAPTYRHQELSGRLFNRLYNFLEGKPCKVYFAPADVLLPKPGQTDDETDTVVQPDILVICDKGKMNDHFLRGGPDIAVEIFSPSTSKKDQNEKYAAYERSGVREYWVIEPRACWLNRFVLGEDGRFSKALVREAKDGLGSVGSTVLEGFSFDIDEFFAD